VCGSNFWKVNKKKSKIHKNLNVIPHFLKKNPCLRDRDLCIRG
jgi:hypothetical protein